MRREEQYRWRCRTPWGKSFTTRHHCTWDMIREEHPEAEAVEGSLIVRLVPESPDEIAAAMRASSTSTWRP